jgi:hypothetical protein
MFSLTEVIRNCDPSSQSCDRLDDLKEQRACLGDVQTDLTAPYVAFVN